MVASRTDSYLRESVSAANGRMAEFIDQSFKELFPSPDSAGADYDLVPQIVFLILEAMALQGKTMNPKLTARVLDALKTVKL